MTRPLLLGLCLLAARCSDASTTAPSSSAPAVSSASTGLSADAASASATGKIGIAECDAYVQRQRVLIAAVPETERSGRVTAVDAIESTWIQQARTVDQKERLVKTCQASLAALEGEAKGAPSAAPPAPPSASANH